MADNNQQASQRTRGAQDANKPLKGMSTDTTYKNQPQHSYRYANNMAYNTEDGDQGSLSNMSGADLVIDLEEGENIVGSINIDNNEFILFSLKGSESIVSRVSSTNNRKILIRTTTCLNFSLEHPISGEYRVVRGCETIIYFTDNYNPMYSINLDLLGIYTNKQGGNTQEEWVQYANDNDDWKCTSFKQFPSTHRPTIHLENIIDNAGRLKIGSYRFAIRFKRFNNTVTDFMSLTPRVNVGNSPVDMTGSKGHYVETGGIEGAPEDLKVNRAINLYITNIDTQNFKEFDIAVLKYTNQNNVTPTQVCIVENTRIQNSRQNFLYDGVREEIASNIDEITIPGITFNTVKNINQINNRMIYSNTAGVPRDWSDFQKSASKIFTVPVPIRRDTLKEDDHLEKTISEYIDFNTLSFKKDLSNYSTGMYSMYATGFMRDEIYALGIVYQFKDGSESPVFHIPGRPVDQGVSTMIKFDSNLVPLFSLDNKYEQVGAAQLKLQATEIDLYNTQQANYLFSGGDLTPRAKKQLGLVSTNEYDKVELYVLDSKIASHVDFYKSETDANTDLGKRLIFDIDVTHLPDTYFTFTNINIEGTNTSLKTIEKWRFINTCTHKTMGYHEADNSTYNDIATCEGDDYWGNDFYGNPLKDQPIRHHRIPDAQTILPCNSNFYDHMKAQENDLYTVTVGLKFGNIQIPSGYEDDVVGFRIVRSVHNEATRTVLDNGYTSPLYKIHKWYTIVEDNLSLYRDDKLGKPGSNVDIGFVGSKYEVKEVDYNIVPTIYTPRSFFKKDLKLQGKYLKHEFKLQVACKNFFLGNAGLTTDQINDRPSASHIFPLHVVGNNQSTANLQSIWNKIPVHSDQVQFGLSYEGQVFNTHSLDVFGQIQFGQSQTDPIIYGSAAHTHVGSFGFQAYDYPKYECFNRSFEDYAYIDKDAYHSYAPYDVPASGDKKFLNYRGHHDILTGKLNYHMNLCSIKARKEYGSQDASLEFRHIFFDYISIKQVVSPFEDLDSIIYEATSTHNFRFSDIPGNEGNGGFFNNYPNTLHKLEQIDVSGTLLPSLNPKSDFSGGGNIVTADTYVSELNMVVPSPYYDLIESDLDKDEPTDEEYYIPQKGSQNLTQQFALRDTELICSDFYIESLYNMSYRKRGLEDYETHWRDHEPISQFPLTRYNSFVELDSYPESDDQQKYLDYVNLDVSVSNTVQQLSSFSIDNDFNLCSACTESFPNRIWYSNYSDNEEEGDLYTRVLANQYLEIPANTGPINTTFKFQNKLFAQTDRATFFIPTQPQNIQTNENNIYVGTNDFMALPPQQLQSTESGYAGNQHHLSKVETQYGVVFADADAGKVFMFSEGLNELSARGMNQWFKDNLPFRGISTQLQGFKNDSVRSLSGYGIQAWFDPEHSQYILHKKDYELVDPKFVVVTNGFIIPTAEEGEEVPDDLRYNSQTNTFYYYTSVLDPNGDIIAQRVDLDTKESFYAHSNIRDLSWTICFTLPAQAWTSYSSMHPYWAHTSRTSHYTSYFDSSIYLNNTKNYGYIHKNLTDAKPELYVIFNSNPVQVNTYDSIKIFAESYNTDRTGPYDFTPNFDNIFTSVLLHTSYQSSGLLPVSLKQDSTNPFISVDGLTNTIQTSFNDGAWTLSEFYDYKTDLNESIFADRDPLNKRYLTLNNNGTDVGKNIFEVGPLRDFWLGAYMIFNEDKKLNVDFITTRQSISFR